MKLPLVLLLALMNFALGDKFLIMHPFYSGSHMLTLHHVATELIRKGHQVVTLRFRDFHEYKLKPLGPNHREIMLAFNNSDGRLPFVSQEDVAKFEMPVELLWQEGLALSTLFKIPRDPWILVKEFCHVVLANQTLLLELKNEKFDLSIVDLVYNECSLAIAHQLKLPSVGYWAFSFSNGEPEMTTVATPPSHIPCFMSGLTQTMTFWQRLWNFLIKMCFARPFIYFHTFTIDGVLSQHFGPDFPSSRQLLADLNGVLINSHNVLDYPRLQPTDTFINIGGIQIPKNNDAENKKALLGMSQELQDWINGAEHGVVLFTMGFIFHPKAVPKSRVDALMDAFSRLPQRFIVKFDVIVEDPPKNVLVVQSFLPQQAILSHPKTLIFFTHCGMHGVMEAIFHAVPMVGMPVFIDQVDVLARIEDRGIGVGLSKWATADDIEKALVAVRDNSKYRENIRELSRLMRLQQEGKHPMDETIWLLEFLSKTKGANHLRLESRNLNFVQYHCLDCLLFLVVASWLALKLLKFAISSLLKRRKSKPKVE